MLTNGEHTGWKASVSAGMRGVCGGGESAVCGNLVRAEGGREGERLLWISVQCIAAMHLSASQHHSEVRYFVLMKRRF